MTEHLAKIWVRRLRLEGHGMQGLQVPHGQRAVLNANNGIPVKTRPALNGHFGKSVDWERLDIPNFGHTLLAFRAEVGGTIEPLLGPFGEFHDCDTELGPMRLFRCLNVVDALASDVHTITKDDGFGLTAEYRFDPTRIPRGEVFTLPHSLTLPRVFYPDEFVQELDRAGISYSPFGLVYDEATGFFEVSHW